tara:strand:- start:1511 stop:2701 length:1191 start_codon:yes stop_codon:yes gene_type:complete
MVELKLLNLTYSINHKMKYCNKCIIPETRPDQFFNKDGVCNACESYELRKEIDWDKRFNDLKEIINKIKDKSGKWDCVIPSSGGKDSTYQAIRARELGLNPVVVTSTTCDLSDLGKKNITNLKNLGFDTFEVSPNPIVRAKLNKLCLEEIGDIAWPEHVSIFTIPIRFALNQKIPMILWGENPQFEYGGPAEKIHSNILDRVWLEEFGGLLGMRVSDLIDTYGFESKYYYPYNYPTAQELSEFNVIGLFLGYYEPWDNLRNAEISKKNGFFTFNKPIENGYLDSEKLDNHQHGIHDYFKFLKYGFGRATDQLSLMIRRDLISRVEALDLVKKHEGKFPLSYLDKSLEEILKKIDMPLAEFKKICDKFTNKKLFECNQANELIKDKFGNLTLKKIDN